MASPKIPGEEGSPSESEGETLALHFKRKRARRVSFADTEITSVHIFRRDEDYETPPDSKPSTAAPAAENAEVLGFFSDLGGDSDEEEDDIDDDDDEAGSVDARKSFLRPIGSPSPGGSSTAGSAISNDENNFFGPVSSSFIKLGRLSDSGVPDDIHEETLDTTAFSMHYRSLARSDSGEAKTPTIVRLDFEDKTASKDTNPTGSGSSMALTEPKFLIYPSLVPRKSIPGCEDSDDMSIVNKNPKNYDFGMLSPTNDELLAEIGNDLNDKSEAVPLSSKSPIRNEVLTYDQIGNSHMDNEKSANGVFVSSIFHEPNVSSLVRTSPGNLSERNNSLSPGASDHNLGHQNQLASGGRFNKETTPRNIRARLEFPSVNSGNQQLVDNYTLQTDVTPRLESVNQHLSKAPVRENSLRKGTPRTDNVPNHDQKIESSPFTLFSSAGREPVLYTPNSARGLGMVPSSLSHANLQSNQGMKHDESISKFKVYDHSYTGSNVKQGTERLRQRLSKYSSLSSPIASTLSENVKELTSKYASTLVAGPKEQLFNADQKNDEYRSVISLEMNRVETPRSTSTTLLVKDGDSLQSMAFDANSNDKRNKSTTTLPSTFNSLSPGIKMMWENFISEDPTREAVHNFVTDSGFLNGKELMCIEPGTIRITHSPRDKENLNCEAESPERNIETVKNMQLSTSTIFQTPHNMHSSQRFFGKVQTQDHQWETPKQKVASGNALIDSSSGGNPVRNSPNLLPSKSFVKEPTSKSPRKVPAQLSPGKDLSKIFLRKELLQSSLNKKLSSSPGAKTDETSLRDEQIDMPSRLIQSNSPHGSDTPFFREIIEPSHSSANRMHISESPLVKGAESADVRKRGSPAVLLEDGKRTRKSLEIQRSPYFLKSGHSDSGLLPEHIPESPLMKGTESADVRKRGSPAVFLEDGKRTRKSLEIQRSPHFLNIGISDSRLLPDQIVQNSSKEGKTDGNQIQKHWLDIFQKFSSDAGHLLSPSINVLTSKSITSLEDILSYVLDVKNYEMLHSEIQSWKATDQLSLRHEKRVAETRLLLCKIAHEKAKVKLRSEKHKKLLKKVQLLKSGIQECQMLKSIYIQQFEIGRKDAQLDDHQLQSCSANLDGEQQVASDTMDTMQNEIKVLDGKIKYISNILQKHCNGRGELRDTVTLASIQDHLMKRKSCRLLHQELQLRKIDYFGSQNGQYSILLNYRGYLSQRFTLISAPVSSIIISNQLNDISISKNFPNMNAPVAFAFVFDAELSKSVVESKYPAQATQVTESLLCNLLDVIQEVQAAQLGIWNLVQSNFHCPPGQELLYLHLDLISFQSGVKVTLILDVTCLSSGTYPSDILPCDIQISMVGTQKMISLTHKIRSSAETLKVGYSRIIRLCRCVSQLLLDSSSTA